MKIITIPQFRSEPLLPHNNNLVLHSLGVPRNKMCRTSDLYYKPLALATVHYLINGALTGLMKLIIHCFQFPDRFSDPEVVS